MLSEHFYFLNLHRWSLLNQADLHLFFKKWQILPKTNSSTAGTTARLFQLRTLRVWEPRLMLSSCWASVPFVPRESWALTAATWLGPGRLPVVCSPSITSRLLQLWGRQRGRQPGQTCQHWQMSKSRSAVWCLTCWEIISALTFPWLNSPLKTSRSQRSGWWYINIRLEDMGILAGDHGGSNLKDIQSVVLGRDEWEVMWFSGGQPLGRIFLR